MPLLLSGVIDTSPVRSGGEIADPSECEMRRWIPAPSDGMSVVPSMRSTLVAGHLGGDSAAYSQGATLGENSPPPK